MPEIIYNTSIEERNVSVHVSERASRALSSRTVPLHVNMELYFSCFIRKMVRFTDSQTQPGPVQVMEKLFASFRPVQSRSCNMQALGDNSMPELIDLMVVKRKAIIPRHLFIDCRNGRWTGDFNWSRNK